MTQDWKSQTILFHSCPDSLSHLLLLKDPSKMRQNHTVQTLSGFHDQKQGHQRPRDKVYMPTEGNISIEHRQRMAEALHKLKAKE